MIVWLEGEEVRLQLGGRPLTFVHIMVRGLKVEVSELQHRVIITPP